MLNRCVCNELAFIVRRCASAFLIGSFMLAASPLMAQSDLGPVTVGAGLQSSFAHTQPDGGTSNDKFDRMSRKVFHCVREIRKENPSMPVAELAKRVGQCFRLNVEEMSIRRALQRIDASTKEAPTIFVCDDLEVDFETRQVRVGDRNVHLTPTQFELLRYLVSRAGIPVTHRELLQFVWGDDYLPHVVYVRVFMNQLRKKIELDPAHPRYLRTEPCIGYCFVPSGRGAGLDAK